jgi:segregation and condensation protein A
VTEPSSPDYRVELEHFSGPLELLLHLLDEEELSVEGIQVSRICDRYLEHLERMEKIDIDAAGEFLVMAATLMRMKSRSLLPVEEQVLEEEDLDPRFELVRQLIEYRRFRRAAESLDARAAETALRFARGMRPEILDLPPVPLDTAPIEPTSADRLFAAFARLLRETEAGGGYVLARDDTPLEQHILRLERLIAPGQRATFEELFAERRTRAYAIGVFLAMLELLKRGRISVEQDGEFGEIWIEGREPPPDSPRSPAAQTGAQSGAAPESGSVAS